MLAESSPWWRRSGLAPCSTLRTPPSFLVASLAWRWSCPAFHVLLTMSIITAWTRTAYNMQGSAPKMTARTWGTTPDLGLLLAGGDWNLLPPGESFAHLHKPSDEGHRPPAQAVSEHEARWRPVLDKLVEVETCDYTHFDKPNMLLGRLDRWYSLAPTWQCRQLRFSGGAMELPERIFARGLSDHSPIVLKVTQRTVQPKETQRISFAVVRSPHSRTFLDEALADVDLDAMPPIGRWLCHKEQLRDAAQRTRDYLLAFDPHNVYSKAQTFASLSRTLWRNDVNTAKMLLTCNHLAKRHIEISDRMVSCLDPVRLELEARGAFRVNANEANHCIGFTGEKVKRPTCPSLPAGGAAKPRQALAPCETEACG